MVFKWLTPAIVGIIAFLTPVSEAKAQSLEAVEAIARPRTVRIYSSGDDPGSGVIISKSNQLSFVDCGTIKSDAKLPMEERLKQLHDGVAKVIARHKPAEAAIEETFVNVSGSATLRWTRKGCSHRPSPWSRSPRVARGGR
jgi:hypothetical protein